MTSPYIDMHNETEVDSLLQSPGYWIVANIKDPVRWSEGKHLIQYKGCNVILLPPEGDLFPAIVVKRIAPMSDDGCKTLIESLLSSLSWVDDHSYKVECWSGGSRPFRFKKGPPINHHYQDYRITYLPEPPNDESRLALAFYREAISLNHVPYSFLSFYKIINLRYSKGYKQKAWIKRTIPQIINKKAKERVNEIIAAGETIEDYLYVSCRCAIAHAGVKPTVDPEDPSDLKRLQKDLPLIKNLVEILIEDHFDIKSSMTVYEEHLYELDGFKEVVGDELSRKLKDKGTEGRRSIPVTDKISIRLWNKDKYPSLENLKPTVKRANDGIVQIDCTTQNGTACISLILDFPGERLILDPIYGVKIMDDGSVESAVVAADINRFIAHFFCNGSLEVWDSQSSVCLGRCDPFMPVNIDLMGTLQIYEEKEKEYIEIVETRKRVMASLD